MYIFLYSEYVPYGIKIAVRLKSFFYDMGANSIIQDFDGIFNPKFADCSVFLNEKKNT